MLKLFAPQTPQDSLYTVPTRNDPRVLQNHSDNPAVNWSHLRHLAIVLRVTDWSRLADNWNDFSEIAEETGETDRQDETMLKEQTNSERLILSTGDTIEHADLLDPG